MTTKLVPVLLVSVLLLAVGGTTAVLTGCAAKGATKLPSGALSQFDADAYNTLITAQAAINQAKATYGKEYYGSINIAIAAYNSALAAYLAYHTGGGGSQGAVQAAITGMLAAVANMSKAQGITPKPASVDFAPRAQGPPIWISPIGITGGA